MARSKRRLDVESERSLLVTAAPLDDDPELAAALGRVVGAWSHLEYHLTILFAVYAQMDMNMAAAVFDFFRSTPTQVEVIRRVIQLSSRSSDERRVALSTPLKTYERLAKQRNSVAHNPFGWLDPDGREPYLMEKTKGIEGPDGIPYRKRPVTIAELNALREEIERLAFTLGQEIRRAPPPTFVRTPLSRTPDLSQSDAQLHTAPATPQDG
jgi:hypothetical protein